MFRMIQSNSSPSEEVDTEHKEKNFIGSFVYIRVFESGLTT